MTHQALLLHHCGNMHTVRPEPINISRLVLQVFTYGFSFSEEFRMAKGVWICCYKRYTLALLFSCKKNYLLFSHLRAMSFA